MRAAVVTSFDRPLEIKEVPKPAPAAGQVLVRIEASGLCHTDIHAARGDWPVKPAPPFVPGHEGVGIVEQIGAGVTEHAQATGSRSRGSGTPAAPAGTASPAGRPCASRSRTPATPSTAGTPSSPSPTPGTWCASRPASTPPRPPR